MHHTSVYIFSRFCTTTTWKCLISRFMENVNKQQRNFISVSELKYGILKFSLGGFAYNWQRKWVGVIAIKTERTQNHFLSDVLVAVASLDLKVPIASGAPWFSMDPRRFGSHVTTSPPALASVRTTAYQCKMTQSTGMATQMELEVFGAKSRGHPAL